MDDATIAALERLRRQHAEEDRMFMRQITAEDTDLILAHIADLRSGGERAKVVADWCSKRHDCALKNGHEGCCVVAIASGAHLASEGE